MDRGTPSSTLGHVSRFGAFALDASRAELTRDGVLIGLRPKTYALLSHFAAHPGRVLAKDELLAAVWPGVVVNEESLSQCVRELRAALGDEGPALIKTVPRLGYMLDAAVQVPPAPATGVAPQPQRRWPRYARMGAALAAMLALAVHWDDAQRVGLDQGLKGRRSVAVMPFAAGDADAHLAEAITEALIADIARIPDTLVIAQASTAALAARESDWRRIGRELGVRHVLTGSVRREGAELHIHAQFVSADDGTLLWAENFRQSRVADGAWQSDIGLRIARSLDVRMTAAAGGSSQRGHGKDQDAIDATLRGQHLLRHATSREDLLRARAHFERALAIEPDSVSALTGLAQSWLHEIDGGWGIGPAGLQAAEQPIRRALALDPNYTPAQGLMARLMAANGDIEGALRIDQRVLAANPSDAWAHVRIAAMNIRLGRPEQVVHHCDAALRLSPFETWLVAYSHLQAGYAEYYLGHDEEAYERLRQSTAAGPSPTQFAAFLWLASIDAQHGRGQEARQHASEVLRLRPRFSVSAWRAWTAPATALPQLQAARDRFYDGLAKAGLPE